MDRMDGEERQLQEVVTQLLERYERTSEPHWMRRAQALLERVPGPRLRDPDRQRRAR